MRGYLRRLMVTKYRLMFGYLTADDIFLLDRLPVDA